MAENIEPVDDATKAKIQALDLEDGDGALTVTDVYKLSPARQAIIAALVPSVTCDNTVCATCENEDEEVVEYLVKDGELVLHEDRICMEEVSVVGLVEYCFDEGGPWFMAQTGAEPVGYYRDSKFRIYEAEIKKMPPPCMASLRRMLQTGPVNRLYDFGLFATPEQDKEKWTVVHEESGKTLNIPHQVHALRVWNAETRSYDMIESLLTGAPADEAALVEWFKQVVIHIKTNLFGKSAGDKTDANVLRAGSDELDKQVTKGDFKSKWTDIVLSIQPPFE